MDRFRRTDPDAPRLAASILWGAVGPAYTMETFIRGAAAVLDHIEPDAIEQPGLPTNAPPVNDDRDSTEYEQVGRMFTDDHWRSTTYRRKDGSEFSVALPPTEVRADYGNGQVFLDRRMYNERCEHEMALRLGQRRRRAT